MERTFIERIRKFWYPQGYELLPIVKGKYFLAFLYNTPILEISITSAKSIGMYAVTGVRAVLIPISKVESLSRDPQFEGGVIIQFKRTEEMGTAFYGDLLEKKVNKRLQYWRGHL